MRAGCCRWCTRADARELDGLRDKGVKVECGTLR